MKENRVTGKCEMYNYFDFDSEIDILNKILPA